MCTNQTCGKCMAAPAILNDVGASLCGNCIIELEQDIIKKGIAREYTTKL